MSKKKPLLIKIVIGISLILFGIIFTTIYKIDSLVQEIIVLKLNNSLRDNSHSLYDYELKNVNTNFIKGNFKINNFKIFIKPKALDSLQKNNILKRQLFEIEFHSLLIKGVDIKHFLSEEEMIANEIALISPEINIFYNSAATNLPTNKLDLDSIFSKIDPSISIKKVNLSNANLKIFDTQQDSLNTFGLSGFSFIMKDLMINSSTIMQPLKFTYSSFTCGGGDTQFHINEDYS